MFEFVCIIALYEIIILFSSFVWFAPRTARQMHFGCSHGCLDSSEHLSLALSGWRLHFLLREKSGPHQPRWVFTSGRAHKLRFIFWHVLCCAQRIDYKFKQCWVLSAVNANTKFQCCTCWLSEERSRCYVICSRICQLMSDRLTGTPVNGCECANTSKWLHVRENGRMQFKLLSMIEVCSLLRGPCSRWNGENQ